MSQREMAVEFMVSPGTIALWETGRREVPGPVVRLIEIYESAVDKNIKPRASNGKENKK